MEAIALFPEHEITVINVRSRNDCLRLPTCAIWYESGPNKRPIVIYSNKVRGVLKLH